MNNVAKIRIRFKYNLLLESLITKNNFVVDKYYFVEAEKYFSIFDSEPKYDLMPKDIFERLCEILSKKEVEFYWIYDGCNPKLINNVAQRAKAKLDEKINNYAFNKSNDKIDWQKLDIFKKVNFFNCFEATVKDLDLANLVSDEIVKLIGIYLDYIKCYENTEYSLPPSYSDFKTGYEPRIKTTWVDEKPAIAESLKDGIINTFDPLSEAFARRFDWNYNRFRRAISRTKVNNLKKVELPTDSGRGVRIVVIENGWSNDFPNEDVVYGHNRIDYQYHGTDVINFIKGQVNDTKIKISGAWSCVNGAPPTQTYEPAALAAFNEVTNNLYPVNIVLFEVQYSNMPIEAISEEMAYWFWLISNLFDIIIIEPAGNNLGSIDNLELGINDDCPDSGAIMIGALGDDMRIVQATGFDTSNYGQRVDCYLWQRISDNVAATSGASAIATCIVAILQSISLNEFGSTLNFREVRELIGNNNIDYSDYPLTYSFNGQIQSLNNLLLRLFPYLNGSDLLL